MNLAYDTFNSDRYGETSPSYRSNMLHEYRRISAAMSALIADAISSGIFPPDTTGPCVMDMLVTAEVGEAVNG